jgi:hypothetical protein
MERRAAAPADSPSESDPSLRGRLVQLLRKETTPTPPPKGPAADADPLLEFSPEIVETTTDIQSTENRSGSESSSSHERREAAESPAEVADGDQGRQLHLDTFEGLAAVPEVPGDRARPRGRRMPWIIGATITGLLVLLIVPLAQWRAVAIRSPAPVPGKLTIDSRPAGIGVSIDGEDRGVTPLSLALSPGAHSMILRDGAKLKTVPLTIPAGGEVAQYFEFASEVPSIARLGRLSIETEPSRGRVQVDGRARGTAPIVISDLEPGEHTVLVAGDSGRIERKVSVEPGSTTSVTLSLPRASGPSAGWLALLAPFDVQVFENGDLVSTGGTPKIMLPAGRHDLRLVNASLGFDDTRGIEIVPGRIVELRVEPPKATLSANARPWADLIIDGSNVGQTPIANLQVAIGTHQVIFRHPQLGEERRTIVVTTKGPNRISVDLTAKK